MTLRYLVVARIDAGRVNWQIVDCEAILRRLPRVYETYTERPMANAVARVLNAITPIARQSPDRATTADQRTRP